MYSAIKLFCQHDSCLTAAGKAAGHRDMDDFIILFEKFLPKFHDIGRRRLGCGNVRILCQSLVEFLLCQRNVFIKEFVIDKKRHREDPDSQTFRLLLSCSDGMIPQLLSVMIAILFITFISPFLLSHFIYQP